MRQISAEIIADSINNQGDRITSYILTYPRMIHSELMTHRMFSRNAASSRAIPFKKMVKNVEEEPFIPIAWQKDHKGMQGTDYHIGKDKQKLIDIWLDASKQAIKAATTLSENEATKQLANRLLEPFLWYTVLVTATEYDNWFELRSPKYITPVSISIGCMKSRKEVLDNHSNPTNIDIINNLTEEGWWQLSKSKAEIHIQALAEAMWEARDKSLPKYLHEREWHIPFNNNIKAEEYINTHIKEFSNGDGLIKNIENVTLKVATARAARLSYLTFNNKIDYEKDMELHDTLLKSKHMSPFEHCARAMTKEEYRLFNKGIPYIKGKGGTTLNGWCNNFKGFIQYRYLLEQI
jgi:thymidylate synthase ThyX